jgi:hypothetical protein
LELTPTRTTISLVAFSLFPPFFFVIRPLSKLAWAFASFF